MKKSILTLATAALLFVAVPSKASTAPTLTPAATAEVNVLISRLDEIMEMDKSSMSRVDKKELREEVKEIKGELKRLDSSVTISVGAVIIIILLLILLV